MKKEPAKNNPWVEKCLDRGSIYVFGLVEQNGYILYQLLADATNRDLWRMVALFRGTNCWDEFLRALLLVPEEVWEQNDLIIENAKTNFEAKEVEQIIDIYERMNTDLKARGILFNLNYDKYWIHRVKKAAEKTPRAARAELQKARDGLKSIGSIPTKASEKCLAELAAYVDSLKETKSRK